MEQPTLDLSTRIGFGFGHVLNDLAASIWFSYALLFYKLSFGNIGYIFVVFAQVIDAITTIVLGFLLDSEWIGTENDRIFRIGRYTSWYCFGTILVVFSVPYEIGDLQLILKDQTLVYWLIFLAVLISQIGWTFCQLSHLSMINRISVNAPDRIYLSSIRQAASIYSSIVVYLVFWFTLANTHTRYLNKTDIYIFANNCYFIVFFGLLHCFVYLYLVRERSLVAKKQKKLKELESKSSVSSLNNEESSKINKIITKTTRRRLMDDYNRSDWFYDPIYYKVAIIYMLARMFNNLPMAYTPLYLQETLFLEKTSIAFIPLLIYFSGLIMSFFSNHIENNFGNTNHMYIGIICGLISSSWILIGNCNSETFKNWQIYIIAIFLGCSMTIIKISSINMVSEMIGQNLTSISFIYGTISCFEKITGGIVIAALEQFTGQPGNSTGLNNETTTAKCLLPEFNNQTENYWQFPIIFYQHILSYGNFIILISIIIILLIFQ